MFFIYKTTNLINGKYYIGKHTGNTDDDYLGSGILLKKAIQKYGKQNFKREVLMFCTNEQELNYQESKTVQMYIQDVNCYNIAPGGNGGNVLKYSSEEFKQEVRKRAKESLKTYIKENPDIVKQRQYKQRYTLINNIEQHKKAVREGLARRPPNLVVEQHNKITTSKLKSGYYSKFSLYSPENVLVCETIGAEEMAKMFNVTPNGIRAAAERGKPFSRGALKGYVVTKQKE
jgi:hypothetical protein